MSNSINWDHAAQITSDPGDRFCRCDRDWVNRDRHSPNATCDDRAEYDYVVNAFQVEVDRLRAEVRLASHTLAHIRSYDQSTAVEYEITDYWPSNQFAELTNEEQATIRRLAEGGDTDK